MKTNFTTDAPQPAIAPVEQKLPAGKNSGNRQALRILGIAAVLIGIYAVFVRAAPWPAELAESNYQSCMIRLEAFFLDPKPRAVVVGTSMTGRLLPEYFAGTGLAPVDNLGLEGCPPEYGLSFVVQHPPPVVIIEDNSLLRAHGDNEALLNAAVRGFRFQLCRFLPFMRTRSRPTSMLYSWFKTHSEHSSATSIDPTATSGGAGVGPISAPPQDSASLEAEGKELRSQIRSLQESGSRVVLVYVPNNRPRNTGSGLTFDDEIAQEFKLEHYDIGEELKRRGYVATYTDGEHLTPASARETCRVIAELLEAKR